MKRFLLLFAMLAALALPSRALVIDDPKACDVNGDGEVNIADLNYVLGCMTYGENSSDANGDGITNYIDYAWIYYTIMGEGTEVATEDQCDFNGDGVVNGEDFDIIFEAWKNHAYEARFDLNHDGDLDIVDLGMIAVLLADVEGVDAPGISIYVKADEPPMFYTWIDNGDQPVGGWPGMLLTETATVNRIDYYVYTFDPKYSSVNVILNNGDWGSGNQTGDFLGITKDAFFIYDGAGFAYGLIPPQVYGNPTGEYVFYVNTDHWSQVYAEIDGVPYPMTKVGIDGAGFEVYKWEGEMDYTPSRITFNNGNGNGVMDNMGNIYDDAYVKGGYYVYTFYAAKETAYLDRVTTIVYEGEDQVPVLEDCAIRLLDSEATWNAYDDVRFEITGTYFNQSARKGDVYYSVDGGQYVKFAEGLNSEDTFAEEVTMSFDHNVMTHTIRLISRDESNAASEVVTVLEAYDAKGFDCTNLQDYTYTGGAITFEPEIGYYFEDGLSLLLERDVDYYAFFLNNVEVGQATLHIEGVPMWFIGAKDFNFQINPQPVTAAPSFSGSSTDDSFTVVIIPAEASVIYYRVKGPDGTWSEWAEYEDALTFTEVGNYCVEAYAVADGKSPSETINYEFEIAEVVPEVTDAPTIVWDAVDGVLTVKALGNGTVVLNVGNETASGEGEATITVEYNIYEGIEIGATAYAQEVDKLPSETVEETIVVDALPEPQPEVTPVPTIVVTPDADNQGYTIEAVGEGDVHLYINGEEVDNPFHIDRTDENIVLNVVATAKDGDKEMSQAEQVVTIPAFQGEGYYIVLIDQYGIEHSYQLYQSGNNPNNYVNMFTLEFNPWGAFDYNHGEERPNVPFYFIVNGERLGALTEDQAAAMGPIENTLQNPLEATEYNYTVPVGYTYTIGIQIQPNGDMYVLVAQGGRVGVDELMAGKTVESVRYYNMAGQEMQEANGICVAVTRYTDGTTTAVKVIK